MYAAAAAAVVVGCCCCGGGGGGEAVDWLQVMEDAGGGALDVIIWEGASVATGGAT